MAKLTCEDYPGKIEEILSVRFPKDNSDICDNDKSIYKNNLCIASEKDEEELTSVLVKYCKGKIRCDIPLAHEDIHLPCRDLNISISVEIIYDCIYCKFTCIILCGKK